MRAGDFVRRESAWRTAWIRKRPVVSHRPFVFQGCRGARIESAAVARTPTATRRWNAAPIRTAGPRERRRSGRPGCRRWTRRSR
ncbi:hypothetical protein [Lysobacter gummosus]|uniref:hypothetical protein n=1 Tax=Lysobacter gummosus TaxID=262324 RepID=UPI003634EFD5